MIRRIIGGTRTLRLTHPCGLSMGIRDWSSSSSLLSSSSSSSSSTSSSTHRQPRTTTPISYQDPALVWAQANPIVAQQCLQPPSWESWKEYPVYHASEEESESWEHFLQWRRWQLPNELENSDNNNNHKHDHDDRTKAVALISHVLSAPLTLARQLDRIVPVHDPNNNTNKTNRQQQQQQWCCVGARAEASLPAVYWKELLILGSSQLRHQTITTNQPPDTTMVDGMNITVQFTGPDIPPSPVSPQSLTIGESGPIITLESGYRGLYHDNPSRSNTVWDAYIFFNPGLAHPNLQTSWDATLETILRQRENSNGRILLTAHSEKDAERDAQLLLQTYGIDASYRRNPFASQIRYQDPFDREHYVRPNHYVALVDLV